MKITRPYSSLSIGLSSTSSFFFSSFFDSSLSVALASLFFTEPVYGGNGLLFFLLTILVAWLNSISSESLHAS